MAEAVRFYWLRREASLTLRAIPDAERDPLRVRRTVAQKHVPDVVDNLEKDRFVAAAWPMGRQISMILCHPNSVKGGGDGFILDTRSLPWVVLRMRDWKQAAHAARLFLSAFGSEATNAEECLDARQQLVEWLEANEQAEMAAIVRRLFRFPLGFRADALDAINIWRHLLIKGSKEQIDRLLREIGARFEHLAWSRDKQFERLLNRTPHQVNRFYCWVSGEAAFPRLMLSLNHATPRRVRGGTYDTLERGPTFIDLAIAIQTVLTEVLEPAAAEVGLEVSYQRLGPTSRMEPRTLAALTDFVETAEGRWPLPPELDPLWAAFVRTAVRNNVAINPSELVAWFAANGWTSQAAEAMRDRFYADAARVLEFEEAGRQPA